MYGKLTIEDMAGGSFTMFIFSFFSLGTYVRVGLTQFMTARMVASSSCMHAIRDKPVVVNGQIVVCPIMVVALTYDHRLMDGQEAVTFLG